VAMTPVVRSVPLNGAVIVRSGERPATAIGPRVAVQPISPLDSNWLILLSGLPLMLRGAAASMASRIADNAIAVGAITIDVRVAGCNAGMSASAGRRSLGIPGAGGQRRSIAHSAPAKEAARTRRPKMTLRMVESPTMQFR